MRGTVRLSDYVANFIADHCAPHVFWVSGGGAMYLNESLATHPRLTCIHTHHEQSAAMAAEAYARASGKIGVCHVTSGPGGTNAITGVVGAWQDSIPMLVISGQASTDRRSSGTQLRQLGVQEFDIVPMVRHCTKYALTVTKPHEIRYVLEFARHVATTGRPGPVWIDLPIDVTNANIDPAKLRGFSVAADNPVWADVYLTDKLDRALEMLLDAKRPVLIAGHGIRLANAVDEVRALVHEANIPVVPSWNAQDMFDADEIAGKMGFFGDRAGNFTVQNADLILAVGTRLSVPMIGHDPDKFAPHAQKIVVDIDPAELGKPTLRPDLPIQADAKDFLAGLLERVRERRFRMGQVWPDRIKAWKARYPVVLPEYRSLPDKVNSFHFVEELCKRLDESAVVVTDMGASFTATHQAFAAKHGQRLFTSSALASMGYGLPAAIGAHYATGKRVVCITGDGGIMFNLQELQTIVHHRIPITIFVLENRGYLTMKLTQTSHFGHLTGSDPESGVSCPDFWQVARAFGVQAYDARAEDLDDALNCALGRYNGPFLCVIHMPEMQPLIPRVQTAKGPDGTLIPGALENMFPFLPADELARFPVGMGA